MAYIAPNSTIKLFSGVPLDNSYRNTLYFANSTQQLQYFASSSAGLVATLTSLSYQRVNLNTCRVEIPYSQAYSVNYMAFKNDSFENKWFYAFVLEVNYINNAVVEIVYELDVMQTYLFDVDLKPCLVEREHIAKSADTIGANVLPEAFDLGEYRIKNIVPFVPLGRDGTTTYYIVVGMVDDKKSSKSVTDGSTIGDVNDDGIYNAALPVSAGGFYDGVYSGFKYYAFTADSTGAAQVTAFINSHLKTIDNIYMMYMSPTGITPAPGNDHSLPTNTSSIAISDINGAALTGTEAFDTYVPVNKKLYTYPYNYFGLTNGQGESLITRYEWFDGLTPSFDANATFIHPVTITLRPGGGYKGISNAALAPAKLYTESITLTGFPLCSWSYDAYSRWAATRVPQIIRTGIVSAVEGAASAGLRLATAGMAAQVAGAQFADGASMINTKGVAAATGVSYGTNLLSKAAAIYEERYNASIAQDPAKGSTANGNADFASGSFNIWAYRGHVSGEVAKMIDNYFSMFGYKCNMVKVPDRTSRTLWNYVKTVSCVIEKKPAGLVNTAAIAQMEAIYDNGITFWHNPSEVGNYTDTNMRNN